MAKPAKMQMVKEEVKVSIETVTLNIPYREVCSLYFQGKEIAFTNGKANVLPELASALRANGYVI